MRLYSRAIILALSIFIIFPSYFYSGEWSEEELRQMEEKRKAFDKSYNHFNSKGIQYQIWLKVSKSDYGCSDYDYFPQCGIQGIYCHLKTFITIATIEKLSGHKIFITGPYKNNQLHLKKRNDFGHYNPDFLIWARENLIPAKNNSAFLKYSQSFYYNYFSYMLRSYYVVGKILQNNDDLRKTLITKYKEAIKANTHFDAQGFYFINENIPPEFNYLKGNDPVYPHREKYIFNGNIVKTGLSFCLRREMDGTFNHFLEIAEDILSLYDIEFLNEFIHISDSEVFDRLASNLDQEIQLADLKKLSKFQLKLLRNGIYATYGYKFHDQRLESYFKEYSTKFCHGQKCGVLNDRFNDSLLTKTDKHNINNIIEAEGIL